MPTSWFLKPITRFKMHILVAKTMSSSSIKLIGMATWNHLVVAPILNENGRHFTYILLVDKYMQCEVSANLVKNKVCLFPCLMRINLLLY